MNPTLLPTTDDGQLDELLVSDLVTSDPRRAAVFERLGIDYCCGGRVPLREACREHGLDLDVVRSMLVDAVSEGADERDWSTAGVGELIDHIVDRHHGYLRAELPRVVQLAHKVARAHGSRDERLVAAEAVVTRLADELRLHQEQEEQEVFPQLRALAQVEVDAESLDELAAQVGELVEEHAQVGELLAELRTLLDDYVPPAHACTSWRAMLDALERLEQDVHRHVHKENHILFPKVMDGLYAAAQDA